MTLLRQTRELQFGDLKVTVKEWTVSEIREWLNEPAKENTDKNFDLVVDLLSFEGLTVDDLFRFSDLKPGDIELLPPSALQMIAQTIKNLNVVFFNHYLLQLKKVQEVMESRLQEAKMTLQSVPETSTELPAP